MSASPSVLLLDDGELEQVHRVLMRLGADYVRLQDEEVGSAVPKPRDLLISSCRWALEMPQLESSEDELDPVWVCVHNQDFLPLRQRLKELGVHFLVHTALDRESLRLFLLQLVNRGLQRRKQLRIPLGDSIQCGAVGGRLDVATLADLTTDMCRILGPGPVEPETAFRVILPEALAGGKRLEIEGSVVRSVECESDSGDPVYSILVDLAHLEPEARAEVGKVLSGERIGTRVTRLAERSSEEPAAVEPETSDESPEPPAVSRTESRRHPRAEYHRPVGILDFDDSGAFQTAFGHDLSIEGVRIVEHPGLDVGAVVTLALYGGSREEPVIVEATVVRDAGEDGLALVFNSVSESQKREIERLSGGRPRLESLRADVPRRGAVVVARVTAS
jgi:hypothetical protein